MCCLKKKGNVHKFNFNQKQLPCKAVVRWLKEPGDTGGDVLMAKIKQRNNYSNQKILKTNRKSVYYQICKYLRNFVFLNVILASELSKLCKIK